jgi:hypothetical protein
MSKRSANNVTRDVKTEAVKVEAEKAKVSAEKVEADAAKVQEAEAEKVSTAQEVSSVEEKAVEVQEAAEKVESAASDLIDSAEEMSAEDLEKELAALNAEMEKLAAEKAEMIAQKQKAAQALDNREKLSAAKAKLEAERKEAEALKSMTAEEYRKLSQQKALSSDLWELAFTTEGKSAAEMQDKCFLAALEAHNGTVEQVKTLRDYWKSKSSAFRAMNSDDTTKGDKKQKAIMRRVLNRLKDDKRILKDGTKLSINRDWKAEVKTENK